MMLIRTKRTRLLLLLMLLVSQAALTIHANSHVTADQQTCQICSHYSNFAHAIPPTVALSALPAGYTPEIAADWTGLPCSAPAPYHQRAPPRTA